MEHFKELLNFTVDDLNWNRKGKVSPNQRKRIKEETSSAVRDLYYIAILFPTVLIVASSVILLIWLFINSPELIREVALGSMGVAFLFYLVRRVLLKDLWDSSTIMVYNWDSSKEERSISDSGLKANESMENRPQMDSRSISEDLYSDETKYPFHLTRELELEFRKFDRLTIYYNPTHKLILSVSQE